MRIIIITLNRSNHAKPMYPALPSHSPNRRLPGITVTVALHAIALTVILSHAPAREALLQITPVMVSLLPPKETPAAPRAKPVPVQTPRHIAPAPQAQPLLRETVAEPAASATTSQAAVDTRPAVAVAAAVAPAVTLPRFDADYLNNPAPAYPALSRRLGEQGRVMLRVFVDSKGLPERIELRTSSGFDRLDRTALDTVKRWKFVPARRGDEAVSEWVLVPISFSLRS